MSFDVGQNVCNGTSSTTTTTRSPKAGSSQQQQQWSSRLSRVSISDGPARVVAPPAAATVLTDAGCTVDGSTASTSATAAGSSSSTGMNSNSSGAWIPPAYPPETPLLHSGPVAVRSTAGKGRGVFATRDLRPGELVDISPVLCISPDEYYSPEGRDGVDHTVLKDYVFTWKGREGGMAMALGLGSLFNHSDNPNVTFALNLSRYTITYTTFKSVKAGSELFIYYGHGVTFDERGSSQRAVRVPTSEATESAAWGGLEGLDGIIDEDDGGADDTSSAETSSSESATGLTPATTLSAGATPTSNTLMQVPYTGVPFELPASDRARMVATGRQHVLLDKLNWRKVTDIVQPHELQLELVDAWVVDVASRDTQQLFKYTKEVGLDNSSAAHLKRVRRSPESDSMSVLVTLVDNAPEDVHELLRASPVGELTPYLCQVPAAIARTVEQARDWGKVWPVGLMAIRVGPLAKPGIAGWERLRARWTDLEAQRVWQAAKAARYRGEYPVACHVTESFDPEVHSPDRLPKTLVRAHDTRKTTGNCLCHAAANAIDAVSVLDRYRLRDPLACSSDSSECEADPAQQQAVPYLLTGLTVFMSHEPCLLCSMSLLHSRIAQLFYVKRSPGSGGLGSLYRVHEDEGLNHRFEVWHWQGSVPPPSGIPEEVGLELDGTPAAAADDSDTLDLQLDL